MLTQFLLQESYPYPPCESDSLGSYLLATFATGKRVKSHTDSSWQGGMRSVAHVGYECRLHCDFPRSRNSFCCSKFCFSHSVLWCSTFRGCGWRQWRLVGCRRLCTRTPPLHLRVSTVRSTCMLRQRRHGYTAARKPREGTNTQQPRFIQLIIGAFFCVRLHPCYGHLILILFPAACIYK
jgi:hypothetical protein